MLGDIQWGSRVSQHEYKHRYENIVKELLSASHKV